MSPRDLSIVERRAAFDGDGYPSGSCRGDWMQTFTGRAFYPLDPRPENIEPADIAHALSLICRYGGHVSRFYSVAEHCVLMSQAVAPENALWALLHDATEAYMGDMIRPVKHVMPAYREAEDRLMAAICDRFGLDHDCPREVKVADNRILRDERNALMKAPPLPWNSIERVPALGVNITGWSPVEAERRYLARLRELLPTAIEPNDVINQRRAGRGKIMAKTDAQTLEEVLHRIATLESAEPCDCGLLPLGDAPVAVCVKPLGHDGLHQTARGVAWADPDDGEDVEDDPAFLARRGGDW